MISATEFRNAMSLLSSAVNIITTDGHSGMHGFTASAVCSVTDTPPMLLVCMNQSSRSHDHFIENKVLAVNVLSSEHESLAHLFASKNSSESRFLSGQWNTLQTGAPVLEGALVSFDCEIDQMNTVGTHCILICKVVAVNYGSSKESLVYFDRHYHAVGQLELT